MGAGHATHRLHLSGTTLLLSTKVLSERDIHTDANADLAESALVDNSVLSESILHIRNTQNKIFKQINKVNIEKNKPETTFVCTVMLPF